MRSCVPLPFGWTERLLDDIAHRGSGHTPDKGHPEYWNGGIKWVSLADGSRLDRGYITETAKEISALGIRHSSAVVHPRDTVILLRDADVGRCAILGADMAVSQHFIAWKVLPAGPLESHFLYYQLQSRRSEFERVANGSTILTIGLPFFKRFKVRYPSRAEQLRIVDVLRSWDEAIDTTDRLIVAKQSKREYHYRRFVSWSRCKTVPIGSVIEAVARPVPTPKEAYKALGIRSHGKGTFQRTIERPEEIGMETVYVVGPHDLIVNITFAWEGAIALAKAEDAGCFVSHRFPTFQVKEDEVNRDFLGYAVGSRRFFHSLGIASPGGAGRNRVLNKTAFLKLEIPLPPKQEQDRIARYLLELDKEIAILKTYLAAIKKQRRALLQKLLTGEWCVPVRDNDVDAMAARVTEEAAQ